ncbi:hypothetical protein FE257_008051 [Aspergillus nanangensis]|uniref:Endonuclease/exonuclease/phosphatase domain-containing protein n=1 Tax=Aspergillus nanangensis TaxID=2582783 RepID=A0AAD4CM56_ASPNN|nr:hypothetical protein FE257_008051 [Aspergillus nanangensis]
MDVIFAQAIKDSTALRKASVPWNPGEPHGQPYHAFDDAASSWVPQHPSTDTAPTSLTSLTIYTWNIDFMLPGAVARMKAALAHLGGLTREAAPTTAIVIFLQECTPSDLATIAATPWVQERFHITDVDATNWTTTHYGTTTLVDSRLPITAAFRVQYPQTRMDRDALFVDVSLGPRGTRTRLCNTHLESMALDPPFRPAQMQLVARYLHEAHVDAALAAGDFNAIQPFDRTLHVDDGNNLKDAFLELGGKEDSDEGFTWGQQAPTELRTRFGCSRMDKVYFCGRVEVVRLERFGQDVVVAGEEECTQIVALGCEKPWVTDHLGVLAGVRVVSCQMRND